MEKYIKKCRKVLKSLFLYGRDLKKSKRTQREYNKELPAIILYGHDSDKQGAPVLLEYIARELTGRGHRVAIVVKQCGDLTKRYCEIAPTYYFLRTLSLTSILRKLKKEGFERILANTAVSSYYTELFAREGYQVVTLIHELDQAIEALGLQEAVRSIPEYSKDVVFPSRFVYQRFLKFVEPFDNYSIRPQGLYLIRDHVADVKAAHQYLEKKYGILPEQKIIINVATGEKRKGFDLFLKMAKESTAREYGFAWIWVGSVNQEILQSEYAAAASGEACDIYFAGYINEPDELAKYYDAAAVLALTSREEPFGSIVLEAFQAGTPVVGFEDSGGFVDTVLPGRTGDLAVKGDWKDMLEKTRALVESEGYEKMSAYCKEFVKDFSFERYVDFLVTEFSEGVK